ncbi:hypothetical protein [Nocardioides speluncae]|uniref:hypothetical protein n=1 Tax=Nocardioides speluncae TaxID=2670337 RepID=UPI000D691FE7|nr:hypothetical protein [Nocardioides speluncae]
MSKRILHHLRGNVVAYLALFLAITLAPTSAYATHLVVRSNDIVNGQVKKPDLAAGAVTGPKIRNGTIGLGDLSAAARPKPPQWRGSDNGFGVDIPAGQSTTVLTLALPAGHWFVFGKGIMSTLGTQVTCDLVSGGQIWDRTAAVHSTNEEHVAMPMSLGQRVVMGRAGTVEIRCIAGSGTQRVLDTKLNAIRVRN